MSLKNCIRPHIVKDSYSEVRVPGAPFGEPVEGKFRLKRDEHENATYKKVDEFNVSEFVESFKNGCDLQFILQRCSLMPSRDVVNMLQQTKPGSEADLSAIPSDLTEAIIKMQDLKRTHPKIYERYAAGESFDSIIKSFTASKAEKVEETKESDGDVNGTN